MVEHDVRKLMRLGTSSTALILPKKWLQDLGLKPGSLVNLFFDGSSITVSPRMFVKGCGGRVDGTQIFIDLSRDGVGVGAQEIAAAYVEGVSRIRVRGTEKEISALISELNNSIAGFIIVSREKSLYDIVISEFHVDPDQLVSRGVSIVNEIISAYSSRDLDKVDALMREFRRLYNTALRLVRSEVVIAPPEEIPRLFDTLTIMDKIRELITFLKIDGTRMPKVALEDLGELFRAAIRSIMENNVRWALKVIQFCQTSVCRRHASYMVNVIVDLCKVALRKCVRDRACRCKYFLPEISKAGSERL